MQWLESPVVQILLVVLAFAIGAVILVVAVAASRRRRRDAGAAPAPASAPSSHDPGGQPALAMLEFDGEPGVVSVRSARLVIGRHSDDDLRIGDVTVSRHHALLSRGADGTFEILNQTADRPEPNQLLVNGIHRARATLADGDIVTVGAVSFRFRGPSGRGAA